MSPDVRLMTAQRLLVLLCASGSVERPAVGDASQFVFSCVLEGEARSCGEVFDRLRDEDFGCLRGAAAAGADVGGEGADFVPGRLYLAGVESGTDLNSERLDCLDDR